MKNILKNLLYTVVVLALLSSNILINVQAQPKKDNPPTEKKQTICHYPPGNPENVQRIEINENSLETHLEHQDYVPKDNEECKVKESTKPEILIPNVEQPVPQPESANLPNVEPIVEIPKPEALNTNLEQEISEPQILGATQNAQPTTQNMQLEAQNSDNIYSNLYPVYRFLNILNPDQPRHFYTISRTEMEDIRTRLSYEWKFEGIAYLAWIDGDPLNISCINGRTPIYRFFSSSLSNHIYTINENERNQLLNNPAYVDEGIKYCVYANQAGGTSPVYRFFHTRYGKHFYTISEVEKNKLITEYNMLEAFYGGAGVPFYYWLFEDIKFYAIPYTDFYGDLFTRVSNDATTIDKKIGESDFMCGGYKFVISQNSSQKIQIGDYVYNPSLDQFFWIDIEHNFVSTYYSYIDHCNILGLPIGNRTQASISRYQTDGEYQMYQYGGIYYSQHGTYAVYGKIFDIYETSNTTPGTGGNYGFPVEAQRPYPERQAICQQFEGGLICNDQILPEVIDLDADGLDDNLENELMYKYAPVLYLDKDEKYFPSSVDWLYGKANLNVYNGDEKCNTNFGTLNSENELIDRSEDFKGYSILYKEAYGSGCMKTEDITGVPKKLSSTSQDNYDEDHYFYVDIENGDLKGTEDMSQWTTYVRVYPNDIGNINIQYWYFFPNNEPALTPIGWKHEGDWEHITIELTSENKPIYAYFAEHSTNSPGHTACWGVTGYVCTTSDFPKVELLEGHPVVYIAAGTHASYVHKELFNSREKPFEQGYIWTTFNEGNLLNVGETIVYGDSMKQFINFAGRWGATRPGFNDPTPLDSQSSSPSTPTFQDSHPWQWDELIF